MFKFQTSKRYVLFFAFPFFHLDNISWCKCNRGHNAVAKFDFLRCHILWNKHLDHGYAGLKGRFERSNFKVEFAHHTVE